MSSESSHTGRFLMQAITDARKRRGFRACRPKPNGTLRRAAAAPFERGWTLKQVLRELERLDANPKADPNDFYVTRFVKRFLVQAPTNG